MRFLLNTYFEYATTKSALTIAALGSALFLAIWAMTPAFANSLTEENGVVENATMAMFALASLLCLFFTFRTESSLRYYLLLWTMLSLVFCGEEISWGQFWLGYSTPEILSSNIQSEANIHNLPWFTPKVVHSPRDLVSSQGLFYLGFFAYFFLLPMASLWRPLGTILNRLRFPLPSVPLLIAIWIPVGLSFLLAVVTQAGAIRDALTETRELYFAFSILLYAAYLATLALLRSSADERLDTI